MAGEFTQQVDQRIELAESYAKPELPIVPEAIPLLSAEDEQRLASTVQHGVAAREFLNDNFGSLEPAARREHIRAVRAGSRARKEFFHANVRLAYKFANRFNADGAIDTDDLVQEAMIGVWDATAKYLPDHPSGARFATVATWHMRSRVVRALSEQGSPGFRYPAHVGVALYSGRQITERLRAQLGREPEPEEFAEAASAEVMKVRKHTRQVVPLDSGRGFGTSREYTDQEGAPVLKREPSDTLMSAEGDPGKVVTEQIFLRGLYDYFVDSPGLSERDRVVVDMRLGAGEDGLPKTLTEVSSELGVSRGRVGQLENEAYSQMRYAAMRGGIRSPYTVPSDKELDDYAQNSLRKAAVREATQNRLSERQKRLAEIREGLDEQGLTERLGRVSFALLTDAERGQLKMLQEGYYALADLTEDAPFGLEIAKTLRAAIEAQGITVVNELNDQRHASDADDVTYEPDQATSKYTYTADLNREKKLLVKAIPDPESRVIAFWMCRDYAKENGTEALIKRLRVMAARAADEETAR